jgi:hypothetical protein
MPEVIKETITTQESNPVVVSAAQTSKATSSQRLSYFIYFIFGALEILLAFRLILKLMGASTASAFVRFIYSVSAIFIWPFEGIFRRAVSEGIETASVLEPSTIVALIVYAVIAWGVVRLVGVLSGEPQPE